MPRCSSCNKFCSSETGEPSVDDIYVENSITVENKEYIQVAWKAGEPSFLSVKINVSIERTSECCGDTVQTAEIEIEDDVKDETVLKKVLDHLTTDGDHDLEIEEEEAVWVDGDGKKVSDRVDVSWNISCCGEKLSEGTSSGDVDEWEAAW